VDSTTGSGEIWRDAPDDFDALFIAKYDALVRSLGAGFGNQSRAEEAVQEAFVRAYTRWRRVRRLEDPAGWVRRVALNLMLDGARRAAREERAVTRLGAQSSFVERSPADLYEPDRVLLESLERLPQQQRLAVTLFYLEDLSVQEVADAMSLSVGAVKYHLHEARNTLRARQIERDAS
jgi:RNA polymerase sigma-70 factor (ECF subfamily)